MNIYNLAGNAGVVIDPGTVVVDSGVHLGQAGGASTASPGCHSNQFVSAILAYQRTARVTLKYTICLDEHDITAVKTEGFF